MASSAWVHVGNWIWILLAAGVAYYGNGETDLVSLVLFDTSRSTRLFLDLALGSLAANVLLFAYLCLWLEVLWGVEDALSKVVWAQFAGAFTMAASLLCFLIGLSPYFGLLALPIVVVEFYGIVLGLHYAPTFGLLRTRRAPR